MESKQNIIFDMDTFHKNVEKKLQTFKIDNNICLPVSLDASIVIEMDLNEEKKAKNAATKKSTKSEMWITVPIAIFMLLVIFGCIVSLIYFYIQDLI